jgi:hypothetical protein
MNIYVILFKSLYARISEINKDIPEITTTIFFSILLTLNVNSILFYFFNSLILFEDKKYNFTLLTLILVINYFVFLKGKEKKYIIDKKEDKKN